MNKKLGLGCMHLPLCNADDAKTINQTELVKMVDALLAHGFTYFDTAYTYHGGESETALRKALVERYPREAYMLTDKMPTMLLENEQQQERIFAEQLSRCGVEYFDRYLVHCATATFYERAERFHCFDFAIRKKRDGFIRKVGFSFHDSPELLEWILTRYPEMDFVQLQISYVDWEHTPIQARRCYETACRHGKPIVAMCPLKGGMLADVPSRVDKMFRDYMPDSSPAEWALRYVASLEGVDVVLSGMSSLANVEQNMAFMENLIPLNDAEYAIIDKATEIICRMNPIQCTGCGYCESNCPAGIPIADYLRLYNRRTQSGDGEALRAAYLAQGDKHPFASACVACRRCEASCPQHLAIAYWIERVAEVFEGAECKCHIAHA